MKGPASRTSGSPPPEHATHLSGGGDPDVLEAGPSTLTYNVKSEQ